MTTPDTLIAIITCKQNTERIKAQQETWIPQAIGAGYDVEIFDGERLNVGDDRYSLPQKTKALCQWVKERTYVRMLKIDDDGLIRMDRFKPMDHDYAGIRNGPNDYGSGQYGSNAFPTMPKGTYPHLYASGGAYWLSRRSIEIIADAPITDWAEDRWVGHALKAHGIDPQWLPDYRWTTSGDWTVMTQVGSPDKMRALHQSR